MLVYKVFGGFELFVVAALLVDKPNLLFKRQNNNKTKTIKTSAMACNNSAVIDVLVENKEIPSFMRDSKDLDHSSVSNTFVSGYAPFLSQPLLKLHFQPASLDSFNSLQEKISELKIHDQRDLCVSVDNPQKVCDTLETYVAFRVTTKTSRGEFEANEFIVRRRYNDFVWLRQKLTENHPFCIIPVGVAIVLQGSRHLPEKSIFHKTQLRIIYKKLSVTKIYICFILSLGKIKISKFLMDRHFPKINQKNFQFKINYV